MKKKLIALGLAGTLAMGASMTTLAAGSLTASTPSYNSTYGMATGSGTYEGSGSGGKTVTDTIYLEYQLSNRVAVRSDSRSASGYNRASATVNVSKTGNCYYFFAKNTVSASGMSSVQKTIAGRA